METDEEFVARIERLHKEDMDRRKFMRDLFHPWVAPAHIALVIVPLALFGLGLALAAT